MLNINVGEILRDGYSVSKISVRSSEFLDVCSHFEKNINTKPENLGSWFTRGGDDKGMIEVGVNWNLAPKNIKEFGVNLENEFATLLRDLGQKDFEIRSKLYFNNGITSTRTFHTDGQIEQYKLFLYLTDVSILDGPYCVIPKSHKWRWRKVCSKIINFIFRKGVDLNTYVFRVKNDKKLIGERGTCFVSDQNMLHRGWPQVKDGRRLVLVIDSAHAQNT